jgi:hypothetical protein
MKLLAIGLICLVSVSSVFSMDNTCGYFIQSSTSMPVEKLETLLMTNGFSQSLSEDADVVISDFTVKCNVVGSSRRVTSTSRSSTKRCMSSLVVENKFGSRVMSKKVSRSVACRGTISRCKALATKSLMTEVSKAVGVCL